MNTNKKRLRLLDPMRDGKGVEKGEDTTLRVRGRHDPCIALRALPVAEAALAFGLLDVLLEG